jgi:malonyl-CoA reductase/3-hydroxypropionate dehydrogenase (NADP+)
LVSPNDPTVDAFLRHEIAGVVALASALDRFWATGEGDSHRVLFLTNLDDGRGNRFADLLRAGVEQLCRVWRHETPGVWCNQIIRYTSAEAAGRDFAAAWVARLLGSAKRIEEINLYLPERLAGAIGVHTPGFGYAESLFGLHMGKVALVTGGSAGIGGQIGRLLALSGALVMLTARRAEELERIRSEIIRALRDAGYPSPEARVHILADCDVSEPAMWERMVNHTLATLGRVDYLINNAGIAGAEEMVIDMPHDAWRHTLQANLISNYALIRALASQMKRHGGAILNVSSYFGGEKYVAIPYPNRADYAVSKAGQRALAEALARFLGPEVQINALAPGPVEGERLKGVGSRPGLFARRARLILENKRLNEIHAALINAHHDTGRPIADLLPALASNEVAPLAAEDAPAPLRRCARQILDSSDPQANSRMYLMNESIWKKLVRRLELGGYLARQEPRLKDESESPNISGPSSLIPHPASLQMPEPFFPPAQIEREATRVRNGVLSMLYLQRMPTEFDVALATVFYLADRNISGETFHPSGGLKFERTVTEGELFGKPGPQRLELLAGSTVFLIGEHLRQHLVALARCFLEEHAAARVVLITESEGGAHELLASLPEHANAGQLLALAAGDDIEGALDRARTVHGRPGPVVSTPFRPLPQSRLAAPGDEAWDDVLSTEAFAALVEHNITHHFRVAQKVSLMDGANLTLVTPATSHRSPAEEFALANFVKTTLHALTATLGAESERTVHHVPVNQVDLTRRARSEEPQNDAEEAEELVRFVNAVLLTAAPLPTPKESRYRSRIYRGNAITV